MSSRTFVTRSFGISMYVWEGFSYAGSSSARASSSDCDSYCARTSCTRFSSQLGGNLLRFIFIHIMLIYVGTPGFIIDIISSLHKNLPPCHISRAIAHMVSVWTGIIASLSILPTLFLSLQRRHYNPFVLVSFACNKDYSTVRGGKQWEKFVSHRAAPLAL